MSGTNTWATRSPEETGRHHRNAHLIELVECDWRCLICGHYFDAASDADLFMCGEPCKHPSAAFRPAGDGA